MEIAATFGVSPELWQIAMRLITRYQANRAHSLRVTEHALTVYDRLEALRVLSTGANQPSRDALAIAALLHDIGHYIADRGHHRHSRYLIEHSDLAAPLSPDLRQAAASLAFMHRKTARKAWCKAPFTKDEQALQCAAILRLADGLDHGRDQAIKIVDVSKIDGHISVTVSGLDRELTARIEKRKADLWPLAFHHSLYLNRRKKP
ncbi:MAG: HD domain-containing protein [Firmicutes bacterium]|nr:HD domain-containing protein [Bacillota bacterium]